MDKLIKFGDMYIKLDADKKPEYGFRFNGRVIRDFANFVEGHDFDVITLPKVSQAENGFFSDNDLQKYVQGRAVFCPNNLEGKRCKIVVPPQSSIRLGADFFENGDFELAIPQNFDLFEITHVASDECAGETVETWFLIADSRLSHSQTLIMNTKEFYSISHANAYRVEPFPVSKLRADCDNEVE